MKQLPLFFNMAGRRILLIGNTPAAEAKGRLIERAGGQVVRQLPGETADIRIAFVAVENRAEAARHARQLKACGLLVNVVDQPDLCDFTTPAIVDRDPVLIAVGTGGVSAGLAKAVRQRIEMLLPQSLGRLAEALFAARDRIRQRWSDAGERRHAIDTALAEGGPLDPLREVEKTAVDGWLGEECEGISSGLHIIEMTSADPDELTLRAARLLGMADHIYFDAQLPAAVLARARADAQRHCGEPPAKLPAGLIVALRLPAAS